MYQPYLDAVNISKLVELVCLNYVCDWKYTAMRISTNVLLPPICHNTQSFLLHYSLKASYNGF